MTAPRVISGPAQHSPRIQINPDSSSFTEIEPVVADRDLATLAREAAFAEEYLDVELASPAREDDPLHVVLSVNGTNQPVMRGVPVTIRRKYVEVLARMKETNYSQRATNYIDPEISNAMNPRTRLVYPFQVLKDGNPKGRAWLAHILSEAA